MSWLVCSKSEKAVQKAEFWRLTQKMLITSRPDLLTLAVRLIGPVAAGIASLPALERLKHMLIAAH